MSFFILSEIALLCFPIVSIVLFLLFLRYRKCFNPLKFNRIYLPVSIIWIIVTLVGLSFYNDKIDWFVTLLLIFGVFINLAYFAASKMKFTRIICLGLLAGLCFIFLGIGTVGILGVFFISADYEIERVYQQGDDIVKVTSYGNVTSSCDGEIHKKVYKFQFLEYTLSSENIEN